MSPFAPRKDVLSRSERRRSRQALVPQFPSRTSGERTSRPASVSCQRLFSPFPPQARTPCAMTRRGPGWTALYVCPKTGLLRRVKEPKGPARSRGAAPLHEPIRVSATLQCHFLDGAWHLVTVAPLPQGPGRTDCRKIDVVLNRRA